MKIKKAVIFLTAAILIISTCACQESGKIMESEVISSSEKSITEEIVRLKNLMSEKEKNSVSIGEITLLNNDKNTDSENADSEHTVGIEVWKVDDYREYYEENRGDFSEDEFNEILKELDEEDKTEGYAGAYFTMVDGRPYMGFPPPLDYKGGKLEFYVPTPESENETEPEYVEFDTFKEFQLWYKEYLRKESEDGMISEEDAEQAYSDMLIVFQSVMDGTYEQLEKNSYQKYLNEQNVESNKSKWEFNRDEVAEIKDSIREMSVYDEELNTEFLVHITLPPDFDATKTYPVFAMTDGVWRFGDHSALRKMMENGEVKDVILVSIGYSFDLDGTDNAVRGKYFCQKKDLFLGFITDNLMPYLSEIYNIDFSKSGLYGHSLGGVFTHYAVFNSDLYENQPFQYYIIGSPAFWSPYFLSYEENQDTFKSEYGYFERNESMKKIIYICGGENEDPDYEEYYGENDSTLEGISNLMKRLENYGVNSAECAIYENSNHYEYIPEMFRKFFLEFYGTRT